jgi:hypothetical protein
VDKQITGGVLEHRHEATLFGDRDTLAHDSDMLPSHQRIPRKDVIRPRRKFDAVGSIIVRTELKLRETVTEGYCARM